MSTYHEAITLSDRVLIFSEGRKIIDLSIQTTRVILPYLYSIERAYVALTTSVSNRHYHALLKYFCLRITPYNR